MKQQFLFFTIIITMMLLWNCRSVPKPVQYKIKGKIANMEQKDAVLLFLDKKLNRIPVDTVKIKDSIFEFLIEEQNPHLAIINIEKVKIPVIVGDGEIMINVDPTDIFRSDVTQSTSALTKKFYKYEKDVRKEKDKGIKILLDYKYTIDEQKKDSIKRVYNKWIESNKQYQYNYIKNNKDYVGLIVIQSLLSIQDADFEKIRNAFNEYPQKVKLTNLGKFINTTILTRGATEIGGKAPNFIGTTPDGKKLSLGQAMGKVTIIDFWASWCKPCRMENPYVVEIYNKYHDQGLNIIGVSLDKNKKSWLNAIEDDGLKWQHVSELQYWQDPIAKMYGVFSIPQTFILDAKGIIRAKNLRRKELEAKIKELLNE